MSLNNAKNILDILIQTSNGQKKDGYALLKNLLNDNQFYSLTSKEIAKQTSLRLTFIRNFSRVLNANVNGDSSVKIYITKHGTASLIDTAKIGRPLQGEIRHSNSCYSEIEGTTS